MKFQLTAKSGSLLLAIASVVTLSLANNHEKMSYAFDKDAAGRDRCEGARDKQEDPETFRLYCINKVESFKYCAITCSDALTFWEAKANARITNATFMTTSLKGTTWSSH